MAEPDFEAEARAWLLQWAALDDVQLEEADLKVNEAFVVGLADLARLGLLGEESAPDQLGPYPILRTLGQGGMSVVHLAWDEAHGRRVALKASHTPLASDGFDRDQAVFPNEVLRFIRETQGAEWGRLEKIELGTFVDL